MSKYPNDAPHVFRLVHAYKVVTGDGGLRTDISLSACQESVEQALGQLGSELHNCVGISRTGAPGEQPKAYFSRTTFPDRLESETECGWRAIAERVMRNVVRNYDEQHSERVSD